MKQLQRQYIMDDYEMFKIVIIGSMGTGKTNIATRYIKNEYNQTTRATVGVQFLDKMVTLNKQKVKVTLWDTAGQEQYKSLGKVYYKGANGVLIVYDVTQPRSYLDVQSWMRLANENLDLNEVVLMIVGNKADLEMQRRVPKERPLKQYKEKFDIDCWDVSAKTGLNIQEVFKSMLQQIVQKSLEEDDQTESVYDRESLVQAPVIPPKKEVATTNKQVVVSKKEAVVSKKEEVVSKREEPVAIKQAEKKKVNVVQQPVSKAPSKKKKTEVSKSNKMTLVEEQKKRAQQPKDKKGCC